MRLAYFTDTYHPQVNGLVTSIDSNREELAKLGHKVLVFAPRLPHSSPDPDVFRLNGLTYYPQPEYTFVFPMGHGFSLRRFEKFKVDLIHCHGVWGVWVAAWLSARRKKLPIILTYHTFFELYFHYFPFTEGMMKYAYRINAFFTRKICNACDIVIAPTEIAKKTLQGYGATGRVVVLPTGLTDEVFKRSGKRKSDYGVPKRSLMLSTAGRLGAEKNFEVLFEAIYKAKDALGDFKLFIAGDGPDRKLYERHVAKLGLSENIKFLGYISRSEVLDLAEASDLFVFASVTETQGMVILESMGRGTPVVAADALGPSEMLASEKGGWLAKPGDAEDFAAKIRLALKPGALAKKSKEAVVFAKRFRAAAINKRLASLYREVIKKHRSEAA